MEHLQWVWHVSRERFLFMKPGSIPIFGTNAYVPIVETSFHELVVSRLFTFNTPRYFLGFAVATLVS